MKKIFYLIILLMSFIFLSCERPVDITNQGDGIPPAVPKGLFVESATDGLVLLVWNSNSDKDIDGYNIYRSTNNSKFVIINSTSNNYYYDDSLNYDDEYYYKISAIDLAGKESGTTDSVLAEPVNRYKPITPGFLTINARNWEGKKSIFLQWQQSQEGDVTGYNIYRKEFENFQADSSSFLTFTPAASFNDSTVQIMHKPYYYKIKAVDKGKLLSDESVEVTDEIYDIPGIYFPSDNGLVSAFSDFKINGIDVPATYKIIVQTNEFFDEFWSSEITSSIIDDTISIPFTPPYLDANKKYYWRVVTYSVSQDPNSISRLYSFTIKQ